MPRIDDKLLDCAIYLYRSVEDAKRAQRAGGSGFLVSVSASGDGWLARASCPHPGLHHCFAVTNRHVAFGCTEQRKEPCPVIRLNTHDGGFDVFPLESNDWLGCREHDIAISGLDPGPCKFATIDMQMAVTKDDMAAHDIGLGDECFLVGRFVNHEGEQRNTPSLRFGNIAMMPFEPVYHSSNESRKQESFLVEIHTMPGYSGSPVFVRPFPAPKLCVDVSTPDKPGSMNYRPLSGGPWLLGVDWGTINTHLQDHNSGMIGVVPAWQLTALLNTDEAKDARRRAQEEMLQKWEHGGATLT